MNRPGSGRLSARRAAGEHSATPAVSPWPDRLLGAAVAFTSATQLRVPGAPVGLGELLLAAWLGWALLAIVCRGVVVLAPVARALLAFWGIALVALLAGTAQGIRLNLWEAESGHSAIALALACAVTTCFVLQPQVEVRVGRVLRTMLLVDAVCLGFLLVGGIATRGTVGPVDVWYALRFTGWSQNPNQLALASLALPFVAYDRLAESDCTRPCRYAYGAAGVTMLIVGVATLSDALMLAWAMGAGVLACVGWARLALLPGRRLWPRVAGLLIAPLLAMGVLTVAAPLLLEVAEGLALSTYEEGGQGSERVTLWRHGLEAAAESPAVGYGPGGYSGANGPFGGMEAHNTPIDWLDQSGVLGLAALGGLVAFAGVRVLRARHPVRLAMLTSLLVFLLFHFVIRHPAFWFALLWAAATPARTPPRAPQLAVGVPRPRGPRRAPAGAITA